MAHRYSYLFVVVFNAAFYMLLLESEASPGLRTIIKPIPIWVLCLMVRSLIGGSEQYTRRIAYGLLLCSAGDVCLELEEYPGMEHLFVFGLASFLVGHLLYIAAFASAKKVTLRAVIVVPLCLFAQGMFAVLYPHLETELVVPVFVYANTISTMAIYSLCRDGGSAVSYRWGALGACVFVVSDTVLAINKFVVPISSAKEIIMVTYFTAQIFLAVSAIDEQPAAVPAKKIK
jgi:uncharacterized membrane protein YhhN